MKKQKHNKRSSLSKVKSSLETFCLVSTKKKKKKKKNQNDQQKQIYSWKLPFKVMK